MPAGSIYDEAITNLLSILSVLIETISRAHAKGAIGKVLMISNLALLLVVFKVTERQAWQRKG